MNKSFYKAVLIGDSYCGKTSLLDKLNGIDIDEFKPMKILSLYLEKEYIINNKKIMLDIWDTCGFEKCRNINKKLCKTADIILLMYNITKRETFNSIKYYYYETMKSLLPNACIIVFFSKIF